MKILIFACLVAAVLALALPAVFFFNERFVNPGVIRELTTEPDGERAQKVMLLTLPSARKIPVNYLREGDRVYAGADGRWWRELVGGEFRVEMLLRGEKLEGVARAVRDDPDYTRAVFARLRPSALPGFGTLIEIRLDSELPSAAE